MARRTKQQQSLAELEDGLGPTLTQLATAVELIPKIIERVKDKGSLGEVVTAYIITRRLYDALDASKKALGKTVEHLNYTALPEAFERAGQTMLRTEPDATGTKYTVSVNPFARASAKDKEAAFAWLRENGHGDLVTEAVHAGTLASFAKEQQAEGIDLPDEIFNVHFGMKTSLRKAR